MPAPREILIECVKVGTSVKVTAMDAATGTEVTFQAPFNAGQSTIKRIAADKIKYVLERQGK
jgi:hypothetical protein